MYPMGSKNDQKVDPVKLSALEQDILTALVGRELYGLALLQCLNQGRVPQLQFGSVYQAVNRLERKGVIDTRWGDENDVSEGARRKYYRVNGLGVQALRTLETYRANLNPGYQSALMPSFVQDGSI